MKEKIKRVGWFLFAPIAYILWTIDYYLMYFGLSFFFYKLTTGNSVVRVLLLLLVIPIVFFTIKIFYHTTLFTAFLTSKSKIIYFLLATLYSLNRVMSVFQYCSVKLPAIPDSVIIQIPCCINVLITFFQIALIFILGFIFTAIAIKDEND